MLLSWKSVMLASEKIVVLLFRECWGTGDNESKTHEPHWEKAESP